MIIISNSFYYFAENGSSEKILVSISLSYIEFYYLDGLIGKIVSMVPGPLILFLKSIILKYM